MKKERFLNEGFDRQGNSVIAIWSNPTTIYQRKDGSSYFIERGRRQTVTRRSDGTLYLATRPIRKEP